MTDAPRSGPCEGIYYIVREPSGWRLAAWRFAVGQDREHQAMWETDLAPALARQWAAVLQTDAHELEHALKILAFSFPRGRVSKVKDQFVVYHGNDRKPFMHLSKKVIEHSFHIVGRCRWKYDEHERCVGFEKEELQCVLGLTEDWPAV